ncbi:MAG: hypothetical protein PHQ23_02070, partial [Candidatus Wallbacteria bacterium]|nr:hypothetical protein [Candidatus Wallbacteria bacterium]
NADLTVSCPDGVSVNNDSWRFTLGTGESREFTVNGQCLNHESASLAGFGVRVSGTDFPAANAIAWVSVK